MYINREPEKTNAVSHKVWAIFRAGFFASKTTGVSTQTTGMHGLTDISRSAESSWRSTFQTVQTTCLWSRESEVNNVCWKCPHHFNSDPRPVDCKRSRSLVGERFSMLQRKPLTDKLFWQSSTIICRPPNSSENHPKKGGCQRSVRGCRCNSLTTNRRLRRSSTNICRPLTTSGNHPQKKWLSEVGDWLSL